MRGRLAAAAALLAGLAACCPIPLSRAITVRPELSVQVVDASGAGAPARVRIARRTAGPPPDTELEVWWAETDAQGAVVVPRIDGTDTIMPLMMHGVTWYAWELCAEGVGGVARTEVYATAPEHPSAAVRLELGAGAGCGGDAQATSR